jgi:hypothetical protein
MLTIMLEILVTIVIAILVIISVLLRPELVHLLRTGSELVWTARISAHRHYRIVSLALQEEEVIAGTTYSVREIAVQI